MIWNKSDPDSWQPARYAFTNQFDLSHHSNRLNDIEVTTDGYRKIPYEPREYPDPVDFLRRYYAKEERLIFRIGLNEFRRYPARTAGYAFECLNDAWLPEDADYYREMDYPVRPWFLETFYWQVIKTYLKWNAGYRCTACGAHRSHTGQNTLDVHHLARTILVQDGTTVSITGIEHLNLHALQVLCSRCHWEAEHY